MSSLVLQAGGAIRVLEGSPYLTGLRPGHKAAIVCLAGLPALAIISAWNPSPLNTACLQLCSFILALGCVAAQARRPAAYETSLLFLSAAALPAIGCLQLIFCQPAYRFATAQAVLYWAAIAAAILSGGRLLGSRQARSFFFSAVVCLGLLATMLELAQIYAYNRYDVTGTGYPLLSSNYYAELIEIILPITLARAFSEHRHGWVHLAIACLFVSTVVAAGARAGTILVAIESTIVIVLCYAGSQQMRKGWRAACVIFVLVTSALTLVQGPTTLVQRLREPDPLTVRPELARSAMSMIHQRPLTGYGLGSFPVVYPAFACFDNGYFVNHAHNDWLEALVDGGPLFLAALVCFLLLAASAVTRHAWAVGLLVLPFHAAVDFPLQRAGVMMLYALIASSAAAKGKRLVAVRHTGRELPATRF